MLYALLPAQREVKTFYTFAVPKPSSYVPLFHHTSNTSEQQVNAPSALPSSEASTNFR